MNLSAQIGIWTDYEEVDRGEVLDVIERAGGADLEGIEIFAEHLAYFHDDPEALADGLADAGLALSGVYYNVDHREAAEYVERAGDLAATTDAVDGDTLVVGAGRDYDDEDDAARTEEDFAAMADMLDGIAAEADAHGIETVVHPHAGQLIETPAHLDALVEAGLDRDAVGLCPDAGHQYMVDADPYYIYEEYADWVRYLHVGDTTAEGDGALVGEGALDQQRLHEPIFEAGYDGWIVVEGRTDEDTPEEYVAHARSFLEAEFLGEGAFA